MQYQKKTREIKPKGISTRTIEHAQTDTYSREVFSLYSDYSLYRVVAEQKSSCKEHVLLIIITNLCAYLIKREK
jgi:hypothetical protein